MLQPAFYVFHHSPYYGLSAHTKKLDRRIIPGFVFDGNK